MNSFAKEEWRIDMFTMAAVATRGIPAKEELIAIG